MNPQNQSRSKTLLQTMIDALDGDDADKYFDAFSELQNLMIQAMEEVAQEYA